MKRGGYLAIAAPRAGTTQAACAIRDRALAAGLVERCAGPTLTVYGDRQAPYFLLPEGRGILWGQLFDKRGNRVAAVSSETARGWSASGGRMLVETYWGCYVAMLADRASVIVVRDPSGAVPCYHVSLEDGESLIAADAAHARLALGAARQVDWDEIVAQLQYFSLRTARTALTGMSELLAGQALDLKSRGTATSMLWSPHNHVGDWSKPPAFDAAAARVGTAIRTTVAALAGGRGKILAEISGGIDSSIVTASLGRAASDVTCITFRGGGADLDESRYAQAVADQWRLPLRREILDLARIDITRSAAVELPRPSGRAFSQANDHQTLEIARATGAEAFFTGTGGDNVLWYFNTAAPALDRLRFQGWPGFLRAVNDLAAMCGVSPLAALRIALRKYRQRAPRPWVHDVRFLAPALRERLQPYTHPWMPADTEMLPGLRGYVRALIQMQDHLDYHERSAQGPVVAPLLAQPIVETCLGIPSWYWCHGGKNRAVARAAFAEDLPALVLNRSSKGSFDGFVCELFERNRATLRAMLLDGILDRQQLLDRDSIDAAFRTNGPIDGEIAGRLLRLGAVEAWLGSVPA